jgi:inosine/xanthosine triphosphatase
MVQILVGSTRPAKVDAARAAIDAIAIVHARFRQTILEPVDVTDIAPAMPMTERAILDGARIRAQTLIDRAMTAGRTEPTLAIGLEGGLDPLPGDAARYALKTWAAVTDGTRWGYGAGGAIVLPDTLARQVLAGRELGDVIDEAAGAPVRGTRGAWGVLTLDLVDRRAAFTAAILAALAPFYNPALYQA